jgi:hypothetical protein
MTVIWALAKAVSAAVVILISILVFTYLFGAIFYGAIRHQKATSPLMIVSNPWYWFGLVGVVSGVFGVLTRPRV